MSDLAGTKGGSGVWQRIISEMPDHDAYLEPFWGRGTVARKKRPAKITIGCDLDPAAVSNGMDVALMFHVDGLQFVDNYFAAAGASGSGDTTFGGVAWDRHFVYFDPPYLGCGLQYYTWFRRWIERQGLQEDEWHRVLCRLFRRLPCPAALSGYWSKLYADELSGTRSIKIPTVNRAGRRVTEWLWLNYDPPARYHDTRFVGGGRRERERIRRRVRNWSAGLRRMQPAERQAVWQTLAAEFHVTAGDDAGSSDDGSGDESTIQPPPDQ